MINNIAKRFIPSILSRIIERLRLSSHRKPHRTLLIFLLTAFFPLLLAAKSTLPVLTQISIAPSSSHTQLTFTLTAPFQYSVFCSKAPPRLIVDFPRTKSIISLPSSYDGTVIHSGRQIQAKQNQKLRFIFDLDTSVVPHSSFRKPSASGRYQLAILLPFDKQMPAHTEKKKLRKVSYTPYASVKNASTPPTHQPDLTNTPAFSNQAPAHPVKTDPTRGLSRNAVIIIDPGHGGKDPGAIGIHGIREKNIVLGVAKDLYAFLKEQPGVTPLLTRYGDYFVPLRGRLKLARKGRADIFLSIHADAYKNTEARGSTVFALSERAATSEAARWLAQKENYSELGGADLSDKSQLLRSVLLDLSQAATIRDSLQFGYAELQTLSKVARLHEPFVEQAPFVVLKSPDIPSLLIETGFVSNEDDALLLNSPLYQNKLAHALGEGILDFLKKNPPPGTYFSKETVL